MKQKSVIGSFVRIGFFLGLLFPVLAMSICLIFLTPEGYGYSLFKLHEDFPLLWIIDSAPFVLGLISYLVGTRVNASNSRFLSEIQDSNEQLQNLIGEKEVLLKEIHHRVKNNLQVITSLLSLQASFIDDEQSKSLFRYSQYRINSMAMIHEMLYQSDDIACIDYALYSKKLIDALIISMKSSEHQVTVDLNVKDVNLNIDTAIPLGLLVNEIITNALKYGIPGNAKGTVYLHITKGVYNNYVMHIGDDGVGFADHINFRNSNSLGLMLMHRLVLQLKGNIEKNNLMKGTNYDISFEEIIQSS